MNLQCNVLWDIQKCPVPDDMRLPQVYSLIEKAVKGQGFLIQRTMAFSNQFTPQQLAECQQSAVGVNADVNLDIAIATELMQVIYWHQPPFGIILVTDRDFSKVIYFLESVGYTLLLIHPHFCSERLKQSIARRIEWNTVIKKDSFSPFNQQFIEPFIKDIWGKPEKAQSMPTSPLHGRLDFLSPEPADEPDFQDLIDYLDMSNGSVPLARLGLDLRKPHVRNGFDNINEYIEAAKKARVAFTVVKEDKDGTKHILVEKYKENPFDELEQFLKTRESCSIQDLAQELNQPHTRRGFKTLKEYLDAAEKANKIHSKFVKGSRIVSLGKKKKKKQEKQKEEPVPEKQDKKDVFVPMIQYLEKLDAAVPLARIGGDLGKPHLKAGYASMKEYIEDAVKLQLVATSTKDGGNGIKHIWVEKFKPKKQENPFEPLAQVLKEAKGAVISVASAEEQLKGVWQEYGFPSVNDYVKAASKARVAFIVSMDSQNSKCLGIKLHYRQTEFQKNTPTLEAKDIPFLLETIRANDTPVQALNHMPEMRVEAANNGFHNNVKALVLAAVKSKLVHLAAKTEDGVKVKYVVIQPQDGSETMSDTEE
ncbi:hypothetical protein EDD86DRAFT_207946 [Gorgonomyces haynaldii]|nr:hypothetical protein EDD86DRAFT_207946 [Gorgonomyces haynaldii]